MDERKTAATPTPADVSASFGSRATWVLYLLFFLSGAVALVYEVNWKRSFSLIVGSTTQA